MTEDFALIDFALSARSPAEIAEAIGHTNGAAPVQEAQTTQRPAKRSFLARLLGRKGGPEGKVVAPAGVMIQPDGTLAPPPLARVTLADTGFATNNGEVRISGPLGVAGLSLIEFRENDEETSAFCERLSHVLTGDEIFYFRHSGSRHPGAHFAFHVYQDGRATRRAISASVQGTAPEAEWFGADSGMPHPLETDSLPAPGTPNSEIMTPVRQAAILEALGIDPETLFAPNDDPVSVSLELSTDAGGRPLSDARSVVQSLRHPASQAELPPTQETPLAETPEDGASWEEEVTGLLVAAVETALPAEQQVEWLDKLTGQLLAGDIDGALDEAQRMILAGGRDENEKAAAISRLSELFGRAP